MERDLDLIREILLKIESEEVFNRVSQTTFGEDDFSEDLNKVGYQIEVMCDAGLISISGRPFGYYTVISGLTWEGHEYLDTIRDPEVWRETKAKARKVGAFSLDLVTDIAKGIIKKKIKEASGVDIPI